MSLARLGEFGLIARIRRAVTDPAELPLGIGDDCAAAVVPSGELLLTTTDLLLEGVHFRRDWTGARDLGRKSVAVNVSDIAAMGGSPRQLFLGVGIPEDFPLSEIEAFLEGVLEATAEYGATLAGGDTCRSPGPLFISVTAQGSVAPGELLTRGGARPGDGIYVSGALGDSALALRQLQAGRVPLPELARRHHDPRARVELGRQLAAGHLATAMIDLSDGLLGDLGHILSASGVGASLVPGLLPLSAAAKQALPLATEQQELALTGGEDYELLFTVPPVRQAAVTALASAGLPLTRIGVIRAEPGLELLAVDGSILAPPTGGFQHFATARRCR